MILSISKMVDNSGYTLRFDGKPPEFISATRLISAYGTKFPFADSAHNLVCLFVQYLEVVNEKLLEGR